MLHLIYIGRHADTIEQFSKIAEGAFYAIQNSRKASEFIDKIREKYGKPITVTSGYRCPELNRAVGGAVNPDGTPKSQHCKGEAADLIGENKAETKKIFDIAKELGNYDQLLFETNKGGSVWVHISYKASGNRKIINENFRA